jgi:hypothetical protein
MTTIRPLIALAALSLLLFSSGSRSAFGQQHIALPPVNLGASSFMDGPGGPGLYTRVPLTLYTASRFVGAAGQTLPGNNTLVTLTEMSHVAYAPPFKVLGGYLGVEVLVPVVFVDLTTPAGEASVTGLGDITFSPLVFQLPNAKLLGRPFFHRLDVDVNAPTGEYRPDALVSVGNHVWSLNPYYAFTWLLSDRLETSWRFHYLWNSTNDAPGPGYGATTIKPGQAIHFNAAFSVAVAGPLRAGVAGYFLQQITDSEANGRPVAGSRERVAAFGPGLFAVTGSTQLIANAYGELLVENRPAGARVNIVAIHVW